MTELSEKLSAYLDGELPAPEAREIEAALEGDPTLQAELEALMAADHAAQDGFAEMLQDPLPASLIAAVEGAAPQASANTPEAPSGNRWLAAAAAALALMVGGVGGYVAGTNETQQVAAAPSWLSDIADYHRVYAGQKRHLVEVPAAEADHIETWLSNTVGAPVRIADLSAQGLTFQGGRLLVAAGKPVAQLMYTDAQDRVVALCLIQTTAEASGISPRTLGGFEMVTWGNGSANFVVVGDEGRSDLDAIARAAATQV